MSDEKSLTVVEQRLTPDAWRMIQEVAPAMQASRYFNVPSPEAAMAIMLKGYELGLSLTASFEFVQVIQGKPTLSPRGALALVQQSPNFAEMSIVDEPDKCTVWMKRRNGFEYEISYTIEEATKAGLVKKDSGWEKYQANMLRWRAVGYCTDVVFPDVIGGMKRADEMGAEITPEGDVWMVETKRVVVPDEMKADGPGLGEVLSDEEKQSDIPNYGITDLPSLLGLGGKKDISGDILKISGEAFPTSEDEINLCVHALVETGVLAVGKNNKVVHSTESEAREDAG